MALCAGALRRWLLDHDALPEAALVAAVPVSVRTEAQKGQLGNQVSMMIAGLPTQPRLPRRPAGGGAPGDGSGQGAARRDPGQPARRRQRVRHADPGQPGLATVRATAAVRTREPLQHHHLQRPRTQRPALPGGRGAAGLLSGLGDLRRPGAQHHGDELLRHDVLRAGGLSRAGARPGPFSPGISGPSWTRCSPQPRRRVHARLGPSA